MHQLIMLLLSLLVGIFPGNNYPYVDGAYDVWGSNGLHLMMYDNGTPSDYNDDFICDWENNRNSVTYIFDK